MEVTLKYASTIDDQLILELNETLTTGGFLVSLDRDEPKTYSAVEWVIPALITAYIAKPFFKSLFSEAGKDFYQILKKQLTRTSKKIDNSHVSITIVVDGRAYIGKIPPKKALVKSVETFVDKLKNEGFEIIYSNERQSRILDIYFDTEFGELKFLFTDRDTKKYEIALNRIPQFFSGANFKKFTKTITNMRKKPLEKLTNEEVIFLLKPSYFVIFNKNLNKWEIYNPVTDKPL